uniref:C2 domain-containing protein n=1 Tax=Hucho hucho TaxID=62062 RepID=A0A4W5K9R0_9TELE
HKPVSSLNKLSYYSLLGVYVCVEVDGFEFYESQAQTHSSVSSLSPHWDQEFSFQVDGAQNLRVLVVLQPEVGKSCEDRVLGKTSIQLDPALLQKRWRRQTVSLGQVVVTLSLKYYPHPLDRPSLAPAQQQSIFCMPIGAVAQQEGVLVPHVVRCCVEEVERRGMEEVGIYRLSAATSDMNNLKTAFNTSESVCAWWGWRSVVQVCCGLMLYSLCHSLSLSRLLPPSHPFRSLSFLPISLFPISPSLISLPPFLPPSLSLSLSLSLSRSLSPSRSA